MADSFQQTNDSKTINKRLALIKVTKTDLNSGYFDETEDEVIEYSPAYIITSKSCAVSSTVASQGIHFQLFSMFIINLVIMENYLDQESLDI